MLDFSLVLNTDCHKQEREAMWINFKASGRFAIRVYVGGVNAISGLPVIENEISMLKQIKLHEQQKSIQDYMVTPDQNWLGKFHCTRCPTLSEAF